MAVKAGDIGIRAASALVLAPAAVLAIWGGGLWFLALMLLACAVLAVEWAMMSAAAAWRVMASAVGFGLFAAVAAAHVEQLSLSLVMLVFCAVAAGLFARSPKSSSRTFAQAMAKVYRDAGETDSIEKRFIAVMASDEGEIAERLRHAMALIASKDLGVDFAQLCRDLVTLMDPGRDKDAVRKRWARDFYGTAPARRTRPASAD